MLQSKVWTQTAAAAELAHANAIGFKPLLSTGDIGHARTNLPLFHAAHSQSFDVTEQLQERH